jgi:hypothetical protein
VANDIEEKESDGTTERNDDSEITVQDSIRQDRQCQTRQTVSDKTDSVRQDRQCQTRQTVSDKTDSVGRDRQCRTRQTVSDKTDSVG